LRSLTLTARCSFVGATFAAALNEFDVLVDALL
jgi:hypothetical protein